MGIAKRQQKGEHMIATSIFNIFVVFLAITSFLMTLLVVIYEKKANPMLKILAVLFCLYSSIIFFIRLSPFLTIVFFLLTIVNIRYLVRH